MQHKMPERAIADPPPRPPAQRTGRWPDPVMNFLITYDVSDPKRLRAVAKALERQARRVQKSVFIYTGSRKTLERIIVGVAAHLDPAADRLQAWPIRTSTKSSRVDALAALPEQGVAIVITNEQWLLIEAIDDPATQDDEPLVIE